MHFGSSVGTDWSEIFDYLFWKYVSWVLVWHSFDEIMICDLIYL